MSEFRIHIQTLSPLLLACGEGATSLIDSDIVFDEMGLPVFPARRLKGLLRESAFHIQSWLKKKVDFKLGEAVEVFGNPETEGFFSIYDGVLEDHASFSSYFQWLKQEYQNIFHKDNLRETFTLIRQQTALEKGVAKEHSLRTVRALKSGFSFFAPISIHKDFIKTENLLILSCQQLRYAGLNRNRGFGRIQVEFERVTGKKIETPIKELLKQIKGGI